MGSLEDEIGIEETALLLSREKALKEENKAYFDGHPEVSRLAVPVHGRGTSATAGLVHRRLLS